MPARTRDAIVVVVLLAAGFGAVLAWHPLGRWIALLVALAGVLIAAGVYRARRPAFPLLGVREVPETPRPEPEPEPEPLARPDGASASTRRPS